MDFDPTVTQHRRGRSALRIQCFRLDVNPEPLNLEPRTIRRIIYIKHWERPG